MIPTILLQADQPPANFGYLVAAFIVAWLFFLAYGLYILRRAKESQAELARLSRAARGEPEEPAAPPDPAPEGTETGVN